MLRKIERSHILRVAGTGNNTMIIFNILRIYFVEEVEEFPNSLEAPRSAETFCKFIAKLKNSIFQPRL
jgi:hypothetical protein